jgi:hypothetical protein
MSPFTRRVPVRWSRGILWVSCALLACGSGGPGDQRKPASEGPLPALTAGDRTSSPPLETLVDSLNRLPGRFTLVDGLRWEFDGDQSIFASFAPYGESAATILVRCLGDTTLAAAVSGERPVRTGFMCFTALQRVASYEWGIEDEVEGVWPGIVEPDASPNQLRLAEQSWNAVMARGAHRLY